MATTSRRTFLQASGVLAGAALVPEHAVAEEVDPHLFDEAQAKLYDATRCIGCRSCARACRESHDLPPTLETIDGISFDAPEELGPNDLMVIQAYRGDGDSGSDQSERWSFIKKNCMHCNVPACASVCPVAALSKTREGAVTYDESRCIGCRYCLLACPYGVPRYEWVDRVPRVRKCDFARACIAACPVGALQGGARAELIEDAHRRIRESPGRYVNHVYGEHEAGGASYLILSGIPLEKFGFPKLPPAVRSGYADALMSAVPGWIIGLGLFLGGLYRMEQRRIRVEAERDGADGQVES